MSFIIVMFVIKLIKKLINKPNKDEQDVSNPRE